MDLSEFKCTQCGTCCRWPGHVRVSEEEIEAICNLLKMDFCRFVELYTELTRDRRSLTIIEKEDGSCHFLGQNGCEINDAKPKQCSAFPFTWKFPGWEEKCGWGIEQTKKIKWSRANE